ncbi:hypothetical protein ACN4EK_03430 [Pantanalinema rosaneae CENA516]|uniref:hypothetical protein n=1 Tax=Pantanalinema rosaneae TaxID=1620701 RepID=UPI003D6DE3CF
MNRINVFPTQRTATSQPGFALPNGTFKHPINLADYRWVLEKFLHGVDESNSANPINHSNLAF